MYNPKPETKALLDRAYEFIKSVPYRVSARWLFYRLLQEGYIKDKKNDGPFWNAIITARKRFYKAWRPGTLVDDTRKRIEKVEGLASISDCITALPRYSDALCDAVFKLDHFYHQEHYIEIWFEAKAMIGQFEYYTDSINLVPFGGDPSISFKWELAKQLEEAVRKYGKEVVILYFGDYDEKGLQIPESAVNDILAWCRIDFELVRCGLTKEQAERFQLPENPARPDQYQWEALSDEQAEEIITEAVGEYINQSVIDDCSNKIEEVKEEWIEKVQKALKKLVRKETEKSG